jgi:hypothetical protein
MSSGNTQPAVDPVGVVELSYLADKLERRATALYLADPNRLVQLRHIFSQAEEAIAQQAGELSAVRECPAGTVKCPWGCCYLKEAEPW